MKRPFFPICVFLFIGFIQTTFSQGINFAAEVFLGEKQLEIAVKPFPGSNNSLGIYRTEKELSVYVIAGNGGNLIGFYYQAPKETKIVSAKFKADNAKIIFVLLSNGNIVVLRNSGGYKDWSVIETIKPNVTLTNATTIVGDAVYVLRQGKVYVSRDTAKTWVIDSTNIGTETVQDVTVDTSYHAWAITQSRNLYFQHKDSSVWRKNSAFTAGSFPQSIFVDRKGRMFISTQLSTQRVWMSTDKGTSWTNISTGITETISSFGDDIFGNVYAVGTGSKAYRLSSLTPPWISIGDSIAAQAYIPSTAKIINSITGDSILYAATIYGMFQSQDLGANWTVSPKSMQARAYNFYSPIVRAGKFKFISTNLGIYRVADGETTSVKIFPQQGYIWGINAFTSDSAGTLYANVPFKTGPSTSLFYIAKSTDFGNTWLLDTARHKALGITSGTQFFDFWSDMQGTQYLGGNGVFYSKRPGQSWKLDTAGLGITSGQYIKEPSLNNKKGIVFLSRIVNNAGVNALFVYSRGVNDSVWKIVNTSSIAVGDGRMISDANGNIIIRSLSGTYKIWRYDGNVWSEVFPPSGFGGTTFAQLLTVDRSGVLWGTFFGGGINQGVYFSTNNGTNWNYVGLNGYGINSITAIGDTVYAVTIIDGIYAFTTATKPVSVNNYEPRIAVSYELFQNFPNPFNPSTTINYTIPANSFVTIKIFDVLGQEVRTLVSEQKNSGKYSLQFDGTTLSSGVYFYRLQAEHFVQTKKLVLLK